MLCTIDVLPDPNPNAYGQPRLQDDHPPQHHSTGAEERGGVPATVRDTSDEADPGVLRIHFPDRSDDPERFEQISWEAFFDRFEENDLAFLYQEETKEGDQSYFFKFIRRE